MRPAREAYADVSAKGAGGRAKGIWLMFWHVAVTDWGLYQSSHAGQDLGDYAEFLARLACGAGSHGALPRPDFVIVREKGMGEDGYLELFADVWERCERLRREGAEDSPARFGELPFGNQPPLVPHTFFRAARKVGCPRVHLPLPLLRECLEGNLLTGIGEVGTSIHSVEEAVEAERLGAACLTAGHIFPTGCKPGVPPRGLGFLEEVCGSVRIPVYAIGGIHPRDWPKLERAGAAGACMMSGYMAG